jgi:hypothetical protein
MQKTLKLALALVIALLALAYLLHFTDLGAMIRRLHGG